MGKGMFHYSYISYLLYFFTGRVEAQHPHEMGFARSMVHRVIFMDKGEIVEQAEPELFFIAPWHERMVNFLQQIL